jgi:hypothetical protein
MGGSISLLGFDVQSSCLFVAPNLTNCHTKMCRLPDGRLSSEVPVNRFWQTQLIDATAKNLASAETGIFVMERSAVPLAATYAP